MSVPTHNLYKFIHDELENKFWIHFFYPWGHKSLKNIESIIYNENFEDTFDSNSIVAYKILPKKFVTKPDIPQLQPVVLCHDQEPLFFSLYEDNQISDYIKKNMSVHPNLLDYNLRWSKLCHLQKYWILLHSELNSSELQKYEKTERFVGAYWWSHAVIARDWYRYAEWDPSLRMNPTYLNKKTFLIYSRDESGTRQYRQKFKKKIQGLTSICQFSSFDGDIVSSDSSATYNSYDLKNTDFSVVLETMFDNRIHLTEKTLRPLACGHPFWLVAGPNSLEYLKSYGFKTFSPWIDESYDKIVDHESRMNAIVKSMHQFNDKPDAEKKLIKKNCSAIAEHNKQLFFSKDFLQQCINELKENVTKAYTKTQCAIAYKDYCEVTRSKMKNETSNVREKKHKNRYLLGYYLQKFQQHLDNGGTLETYVPPDLD